MGAGWGMLGYGLAIGASFTLFAGAVEVTATVAFVLIRLKREQLAAQLLAILLTVLIGYRAAVIRSTLNASFFALVLLTSAFLTGPLFTSLLFAVQMGYIVVCTFLGVFSWTQTRDPVTGLYYADTVTVLIPLLLIIYVVAFVISKILISAVEKEAQQGELLRRTQERLVVQERLSSARVLAGGIAHDFNNILVALIGNLELLASEMDGRDPRLRLLGEARSAANRARELTSQLLMLSKGNPPSKTLASVPDLIRETAGMTLRGSSCRAEFQIAPDLWPIEADAVQISQVIQNLVLNAREAMPGGGVVRVGAENRNVDAAMGQTLKPGPYVLISVSDQGAGIPRELLNRIFDPFYSTKTGGTGLGLSICYSVVSNHQGGIDVQSSPGEGARFEVYLPARPGANPEAAPVEASRGERKYSGRVLVMDDDAAVRRVLQHMLELMGFEVEAVPDGEQAVRAASGDRPYAFLIMDLTVPGGLGGGEALSMIRARDPGVKAVVSSGYSAQLLEGTYEAMGFQAVLRKPYTLAELTRVVERILSA